MLQSKYFFLPFSLNYYVYFVVKLLILFPNCMAIGSWLSIPDLQVLNAYHHLFQFQCFLPSANSFINLFFFLAHL